ncbi:hypothetical protein, partial [Streptomyces halstedii]|uniref:hypothetical protein n=1 Tax=Streptomyces halstedii TaxID=1944 RepID=UPI0033486775
MQLVNGADGGTQGLTVTPANSGGASGNAWNAVAGTPNIVYDGAHARGALAYKLDVAAATTPHQVVWTSASMGAVTQLYGRLYLWTAAHPVTNRLGLVRFMNGASQAARLILQTDGTLQLTDAGNAAELNTTTPIATGQWVRVEWRVVFVATGAAVEVRLFNDADSTVATQVVSGTASGIGAACDSVQIGAYLNGLASSWTAWLDSIELNDTGFPGPLPDDEPEGTGAITGAVTLAGSGFKSSSGTGAAVVTFASSPAPSGTKATSGTGTAAAAAALAGSGGAIIAGTGAITAAAVLSGSGFAAPPAFPIGPLNVTVEIDLGDGWIDITEYAYLRNAITLGRGTPDEATKADPATLSMTLNNRDGRFSPRNPLGPYYGRLGRNTPVRITAEGSIRGVLEVSAWPRRWDVSGEDRYVPVAGAGIMRRLGQGKKVLQSALRRSIAGVAPYAAWWPLEDAAGSEQAASGYALRPAMRVDGSVTFTGEVSAGLAGGVQIGKGGRLTGAVAEPLPGWVAAWWFDLPEITSTEDEYTHSGVLHWECPDTPGASHWTGYARANPVAGVQEFVLQGADEDGGAHLFLQHAGDLWGVGPVQIAVHARTTGAGIVADLYVGGELVETTTSFPGDTITPIVSIGINNVQALAGIDMEYAGSISHLLVADGARVAEVNGHTIAGLGYLGETAGDRIIRLCEEEGIPLVFTGDSQDTPQMGPQAPAKFLELLGEAADVDAGHLGEQREAIGLTYITRASSYNTSPDMTVAYEDLAPPLEPTPDDQRTRNDVTVTRQGGSSARVVVEDGPLSVQDPPHGVGTYDEGLTLNLQDDGQPLYHAGWRAHRGTWDEDRWPLVHLDLAAVPALIPGATALDSRSHLRITGLMANPIPEDVDLLVEGYEETLDMFGWDISVNSSPQGPYRVGVVEDAELAHVDADEAELAAGATADATA